MIHSSQHVWHTKRVYPPQLRAALVVPGVTSPSRPLQIGRAKMGGRGRAEGSEGTPGRKKRRQKQGSPPQVGDEITTELDSYSLLEPIGEDTERELATFHLLVSSAASERTQECASRARS